MLPLKGHTRGKDTFQAFMNFANKTKVPLVQLISITTDGAPAMLGSSNGIIALFKQNNSFLNFIHYHCIIHQAVLCAKILNMKEIMDIAMKIALLNSYKDPAEKTFPRSLERGTGRAHRPAVPYRCEVVE